jgi:hypothetical protein
VIAGWSVVGAVAGAQPETTTPTTAPTVPFPGGSVPDSSVPDTVAPGAELPPTTAPLGVPVAPPANDPALVGEEADEDEFEESDVPAVLLWGFALSVIATGVGLILLMRAQRKTP